MQRINIHIQYITVFVNNTHRFLHFAIGFYFLQSAISSHTMIYMRYIITRLQIAQGFECDGFVLIVRLFYLVFMVTLEDLVIGITNTFQFFINKPFVYTSSNGNKLYFRIQISKNAVQSFQLTPLFRKQINIIPLCLMRFQVGNQKVKLAVERWLRT